MSLTEVDPLERSFPKGPVELRHDQLIAAIMLVQEEQKKTNELLIKQTEYIRIIGQIMSGYLEKQKKAPVKKEEKK